MSLKLRTGRIYTGHLGECSPCAIKSAIPKDLIGKTDDERLIAARDFLRRAFGLAMSRDDCGDDPEAERAMRAAIDRKAARDRKNNEAVVAAVKQRQAEIARIRRRIAS